MDIALVMGHLGDAKQLMQSAMEQLKAGRAANRRDLRHVFLTRRRGQTGSSTGDGFHRAFISNLPQHARHRRSRSHSDSARGDHCNRRAHTR